MPLLTAAPHSLVVVDGEVPVLDELEAVLGGSGGGVDAGGEEGAVLALGGQEHLNAHPHPRPPHDPQLPQKGHRPPALSGERYKFFGPYVLSGGP